VEAGSLAEETASSMVGAAMLSVFLFPVLGLILKQRARTTREAPPQAKSREPAPSAAPAGPAQNPEES
jgi:hypothetical protein